MRSRLPRPSTSSFGARIMLFLLIVAGLSLCGTTTAFAQLSGLPAVPPDKPPGVQNNTPELPKSNLPARRPQPRRDTPDGPSSEHALQPFGANLFMGNFLRTREDGLNPDYVLMPGDQVAVNVWGAVQFSNLFVVDGQGNIFLPEVGPIRLAGVRNAELTEVVRKGMQRVYARGFDVYTNLITAKPVAVFVTGGVVRPGRYAGIPSDSALFFIDQAGGIEPHLGSYRNIKVLREGQPLVEMDLYDFILQGKLQAVQFKDGDTILVEKRGPVVELRGDVAQPAMLEFPSDPVSGADALAVIPGIARATEVTIEGVRSGAPFSHTLSVEAFSSYDVHDGDTITVRSDGYAGTILVRLEGEFQGPTVLAIRRGARLIDVLNHVPVNPALADVSAVHIRRSSVAQAQKRSIDDALFRLERSALLALSSSSGESAIRAKEAELTLSFVERARLIQPLGRVVTARNGVQHNLRLEQDDVIVIPPRTNVVRVSGEVMLAQAVMFREGMTARDYIQDAGGYSDRADKRKVIVVRPNAEVSVGGPRLAVYPGDEVLVPPRVDTKVLQNFADVTQVVYQIAVSAAVMVAIM